MAGTAAGGPLELFSVKTGNQILLANINDLSKLVDIPVAAGEIVFAPAIITSRPIRLAEKRMQITVKPPTEEQAMKTAKANKMREHMNGAPAPLATPTDLTAEATRDVTGAMNAILADVFALYVKTKNFHWHLSGAHFRDYHLMFDEQGEQIFAMTDDIAERVRKIGGTTITSIGHIARLQRVSDNDATYVEPEDMLAELCDDNKTLAARLREAHNVCDEHRDIATASLIENWIDQTERRTWFLFEASQREMTGGH